MLENATALVTGAFARHGRAIAMELARRGAHVVGTATSEAGAAASASTCRLPAERPRAGARLRECRIRRRVLQNPGAREGTLSIWSKRRCDAGRLVDAA